MPCRAIYSNNLIIGCTALYILWCCLNLREPIAEALLWKWALLLAIFVFVHLLPRKEWVLWALTAAGFAQAVDAVGQQAGYIASNHGFFPVTGFMGNPGQLGGFQAVALLTAAVLAVKTDSQKLRLFVFSPLLVLIAFSLWLADSRAGWVAVAAGAVVLLWPRIRQLFITRRWLFLPILFMAIIVATALFNYRSESAKSRLLIWRVTADMVADKLLAGHGAGGFNGQYMLYQAEYFDKNPDSTFLMVADNAAYPYNEFLHILVEQGIVGLSLFLAVIVGVFATAGDKRMLAPLAGLLVFSFFSYPSYKFGLLILFPLLLGCVVSGPECSISPRWRYSMLVAFFLFAAFIGFEQIRFYDRAKVNAQRLMRSYDRQAANFMSANFDRLRSDLHYNSIYLHWLTTYPEMADEQKLGLIMPTCENWCVIGDYFAAQGHYAMAERYYLTASRMIPTRMLPNYRLWKLYLEQGKTEQARQVGERILSQPLKVENTFTLRVKGEVGRWHNSNGPDFLSGFL